MSGFYVVAGLNHFINPSFYSALIPPYLPLHTVINYGSGAAEILLGLGLLSTVTRRPAAIGIIVMLIAFIPAHIHFIIQDSCLGELCVPTWVGWVRLLAIHPVLLLWAWSVSKVRD